MWAMLQPIDTKEEVATSWTSIPSDMVFTLTSGQILPIGDAIQKSFTEKNLMLPTT
jgi:hypothetical protein